MSDFSEWNHFYSIVGSAAAALIGLQFVAMTLIANRPSVGAPDAGAAFATPTIVHFGVTLLLSAVVSIPWHETTSGAIVLGIVGVSGVVYSLVVTRRMRAQSVYKPVFEDWLFHCLLPFVAYIMLSVASYVAFSHARPALFLVAIATLMFLFVGIHNAWDGVTYHIFTLTKKRSEAEPQ